ncbi:MAG TPA: Fe-Mn family superoxide dismutase [Candidatus Binatia bacterium]
MYETGLYAAKHFSLSGLHGISDRTLEMHFKLYEGYVKETNRLMDKLSNYSKNGSIDPSDMEVYSELTRRLGFEYNGMLLHEYYFGNLKRAGNGDPRHSSRFYQAADESFGRYENWKRDFVNKGNMRGVGWVICYQDPSRGRLTNHWISLHEIGNVVGFRPVLVMDVWEHAFLLDYKPADRAKYVDAFFANIDWDTVHDRLGSHLAEQYTF